MTDDDTKMLRELITRILLDLKQKRLTMKEYCTQNNGNCWTCSLVSYGKDCQNNPVPSFPVAVYNVYESDLEGWTVETLAAALEEPMADIGVRVEAHPRVSGPVSLVIHADMPPAEEDLFRETVRALVDQVIVEGKI